MLKENEITKVRGVGLRKRDKKNGKGFDRRIQKRIKR